MLNIGLIVLGVTVKISSDKFLSLYNLHYYLYLNVILIISILLKNKAQKMSRTSFDLKNTKLIKD